MTPVRASEFIAALERDVFRLVLSDVPARAHTEPRRLVYTAFDGDDFYFTDLFSTHAFAMNWIPINPEACIGYKQAVDSLHTKERVLAADVALLAKADQIWLYTEQRPDDPCWSDLAEGALVELMYWLSLPEGLGAPSHQVYFVDIQQLARGGTPEPKRVHVTPDDLRSALTDSHPEVLELVLRLLRPGAVPPVATAIYHVADSKYAQWLREWMLTQGFAPIIPTLAFPSGATRGLGDLVAAWRRAVQVSDFVFVFDPLNRTDPVGDFAKLIRSEVVGDMLRGDWSAVGAPKAVKGVSWPITAKEQRERPANLRVVETEWSES